MAKSNDELERTIKQLEDRIKNLEESQKRLNDNFTFRDASNFKQAVREAIKEKL